MNKEEFVSEYARRVSQAAFKRYRPYGHPDTLCPDGKLWKRMGWPKWSNKPWQLEFHQSGKENKERAAIDANGVGKCATIRTYVDTPTGKKRLRDIWGTETEVLTWPNKEPRRVTRWIRKPPEECFRIVMADGQWFECPAGHLILTNDGWRSLATIVSLLPKSVSAPLGRCSFSSRLARVVDARRWFGTLRGWWDRYVVDPRLCGGPLLWVEDNVQVFAPLPSGVRRRNVVSCNVDDPVGRCTSILLRACVRLSKSVYVVRRALGQWFEFLACVHSTLAEPCIDSLGGSLPLHPESVSRFQSGGVNGQGQSGSSSFGYPSIDANRIVSVNSVGVHVLYDMEVEERHNYIAAGLVHHNSYCTTWELAAHVMGEYPDWYDGFRFDKPIEAWVGAIDADQQRIGVQTHLLGTDLEKNLGTGFIPRDRIPKKPSTRQAGISDVADKVLVRHSSSGYSVIIFKTYAQGWRSWQGGKPRLILLDEEPDENDAKQRDIFEECQTRIFRSDGILLAGLTPLLGETSLTRHFMSPKAKGIHCVYATWDDAPHLSEEGKDRLRKTYQAHKLATRTQGVPMMGEGRIIDVDESDYRVSQFEIPRYFARIVGIDFGIGVGHPTAAGLLCWDRDKDTVYLVDEYRKEGMDALYHATAIKKWGTWIPVSWPHDGHKTSDLTKEKSDGTEIKDIYRKHGLNMLGISARYDKDKGGSQPVEPIIEEFVERVKTGRFYATENCFKFFEECRSFHRKDGKIVNRREDLIKAVLYGLMMLRYSSPEPRHRVVHSSARPLRAAV